MSELWSKKSHEELKDTVFSALSENVNYTKEPILGIPASYLDDKVFNQDDSFLQNAPFISTLVQNPNHIGCHTLGKSESFFKGTQAIEKEVIRICASDILKGGEEEFDGYVASGGTEANMQAIWVYRNYFMRVHNAELSDIAIVCSSDSHYSMDKAGNILMLDVFKTPVNEKTRDVEYDSLTGLLTEAVSAGKKHFIVVCNMMTTMFGSVDTIGTYTKALNDLKLSYKLHVDGAYGGFYYPFSEEDNQLSFANPAVTSITLDAHKMAQAPYGTGIFLIRKNHIHYAHTEEASYVEGEDCTMIGSRSGANAVAIWMILSKNGPHGWFEKVYVLQRRTLWICEQLDRLEVPYYRHPKSNIVTMRASHITKELAQTYGLVPDKHDNPSWYKIVVMDHVTLEKLTPLMQSFDSE